MELTGLRSSSPRAGRERFVGAIYVRPTSRTSAVMGRSSHAGVADSIVVCGPVKHLNSSLNSAPTIT
jgi:hypothetical protein